jgi:hypothetical protein
LEVEDDQLTAMGKLLVLFDNAPRCRCGGDCETLKFFAKKLIEANSHEQWLLFSKASSAERGQPRELGNLLSWLKED